MPNILIAGGGSGGHVAPAIAVAEALKTRGYIPILAHSNRRVDSTMVSQTPFKCFVLPAQPLSLNPLKFLNFCFGFRQTEKKVKQIIDEQHIECVLATGGFVAAPALRAARRCGCPTVLLNLDSPPGKANRLAERWVDCILSTVECVLKNFTLVSPPLRQCVIAPADNTLCYKTFELNPHLMTLLVTGASQGASSINEFIPALAKQNPTYFQGWQVIHIAGANHKKNVEELWKEIDVPSTVIGFVQEMGLAWGATDLAITRGGANTIAELAINAIPAVVLPYPYHNDDHQRTNALPLAKTGGILIEKDYVQTTMNLAHAGSTICKLLKDHQQRFTMRQTMTSTLPENGAIAIADACIASIGR